jgi:hypothetical protein
MKWINYLLQFLFIRLTRHEVKHEVSALPDGGLGIGGTVSRASIIYWYSIQYWIVPLTGWTNNFVYLNKAKKPRYKSITKKREIKIE